MLNSRLNLLLLIYPHTLGALVSWYKRYTCIQGVGMYFSRLNFGERS